MRIEGVILPIAGASGVSREAWCRLVDRRPEFRRPEPRQLINPFIRAPMMSRPTRDVAAVVVDGEVVGNVSWSMDEDDPLVVVRVGRSASSLVRRWAAELGGEFREDRASADV